MTHFFFITSYSHCFILIHVLSLSFFNPSFLTQDNISQQDRSILDKSIRLYYGILTSNLIPMHDLYIYLFGISIWYKDRRHGVKMCHSNRVSEQFLLGLLFFFFVFLSFISCFDSVPVATVISLMPTLSQSLLFWK